MPKMFVHPGASLHRHEYSPPLERSNPIASLSCLTSPTYSSSIRNSSTITENPSLSTRRPGRSLSDVSLRTYEHTVRFQEHEESIMHGDDGKSVATSEDSEVNRIVKARRRASKGTSSFQFAYSAPTQLRKQRLLHIRPKKLLQLHYLPATSRPVPNIDVLTSMVVVPRVIKRFPRMFRGKGELGANDVMIVRSEEYDSRHDDSNEATDSDEEALSSRELLAVICQAPKDLGGSVGRAEIVLADGSLWTATPIVKDSFEFVKFDDAGCKTVARWVRKSSKGKRAIVGELTDAIQEPQYSFSIIDPGTRKHPIMATLIPNNLKINDYYSPLESTIDSSAPNSPISKPLEEHETQSHRFVKMARSVVPVDEKLRTLIQVTAIWVGLRNGWCPHFKYNDSITTPNPSARTRVASSSMNRSTSVSMVQDTAANLPGRAGTPDSSHSPLVAVGDRLRRSCALNSPQLNTSTFETPATQPRRTVSTGSAFMQRTAARRGYSYPSVNHGSEFYHESQSSTGMEIDHDRNSKCLSTHSHSIDDDIQIPVSPHQHSQLLNARVRSLSPPRDVRHQQPDEFKSFAQSDPPTTKKNKGIRWKTITNLFRRGPRSN